MTTPATMSEVMNNIQLPAKSHVLHIGAGALEELPHYKARRWHTIWVEASPLVFDTSNRTFAHEKIYRACIAATSNKIVKLTEFKDPWFNTTRDMSFSSIPSTGYRYVSTMSVPDFMKQYFLKDTQFALLVISTQGTSTDILSSLSEAMTTALQVVCVRTVDAKERDNARQVLDILGFSNMADFPQPRRRNPHECILVASKQALLTTATSTTNDDDAEPVSSA